MVGGLQILLPRHGFGLVGQQNNAFGQALGATAQGAAEGARRLPPELGRV